MLPFAVGTKKTGQEKDAANVHSIGYPASDPSLSLTDPVQNESIPVEYDGKKSLFIRNLFAGEHA
jgi:hypothetical protein